MSRHDYERSGAIAASGEPFAALVMAAMRRADSANYERLKGAFPEIERELRERYHAPGGRIGAESEDEHPSAREIQQMLRDQDDTPAALLLIIERVARIEERLDEVGP